MSVPVLLPQAFWSIVLVWFSFVFYLGEQAWLKICFPRVYKILILSDLSLRNLSMSPAGTTTYLIMEIAEKIFSWFNKDVAKSLKWAFKTNSYLITCYLFICKSGEKTENLSNSRLLYLSKKPKPPNTNTSGHPRLRYIWFAKNFSFYWS